MFHTNVTKHLPELVVGSDLNSSNNDCSVDEGRRPAEESLNPLFPSDANECIEDSFVVSPHLGRKRRVVGDSGNSKMYFNRTSIPNESDFSRTANQSGDASGDASSDKSREEVGGSVLGHLIPEDFEESKS